MKEVLNLSVAKLKQIIALKAKIEQLQSQLEKLAGNSPFKPSQKTAPKKRTLSAAARKKISQAAKARWAKVKAAKAK
ncbi:MAG TPA: hypothetical protein VHG71_05090 [Verrucomicrobiae bacterium]|nr:hypothetical protein [Verrucomicrobiae bacterium]